MTDRINIEDLRERIGQEVEVCGSYEVEKGATRNFAEAIGYPHPLYVDEAYARSKGYRSVIAPPTFAGYDLQRGAARRSLQLPFKWSALHGGDEWKFLKVIQAGDILTPKARISDILVKEGKKGQLLFVVIEVTYTNQENQVVATYRSTAIIIPEGS